LLQQERHDKEAVEMRSIKPGRGPSAMGAVGSVVGIIFGIFWTIMAFTITKDAPFPFVHVFFPLFGLLFIGAGVANLIYNAANATGRNRMSVFDITEEHEESDPIDTLIRGKRPTTRTPAEKPPRFYPYSGTGLKQEFKFCPNCGKSV
jgi:hypothetical protein